MKYLHKFNEDNAKKISSDRVNQIIKEMDSLTQVINDNLVKTKAITDELSGYTSKSSKNNNQIDDAFVNLGGLTSKLSEVINSINAINTKLKDYTEHGEASIY
jgi:ABC-type transporter Mla subunit MlaD